MAEIDDDARKEAGLGCAQEETNNVKLHGCFNEAHGNRQQTPGDHNPRNPLSCAPMFDNEAAGDLEQEVADEKYTRAEAVHLRGETEVFTHLEGRVTNVNAVQESDDVNEKEVRQDATHDAPARSRGNCGRFGR